MSVANIALDALWNNLGEKVLVLEAIRSSNLEHLEANHWKQDNRCAH